MNDQLGDRGAVMTVNNVNVAIKPSFNAKPAVEFLCLKCFRKSPLRHDKKCQSCGAPAPRALTRKKKVEVAPSPK